MGYSRVCLCCPGRAPDVTQPNKQDGLGGMTEEVGRGEIDREKCYRQRQCMEGAKEEESRRESESKGGRT